MHIISGNRKNHPILAPKGSLTRPTSSRLRESIFNICQGYIEGATFLDLFAGSGAIGLEALSRGAARCTFVDNSRDSIQCIKANLSAFGMEKTSQVIFADVFAALKRLIESKSEFDIIFADPPYEKKGKSEGELYSYSGKVLEMIDRHPMLIAPGGHLFIEDARTFIPKVTSLTSLQFINSRSAGRTSLHQFQSTR